MGRFFTVNIIHITDEPVAPRQALNRAVKIFKSLDRTIDEAETLLHIGNIEFEQGPYDQATRRYHNVLKLCKTLDADEMKANVNLSLGAIHQTGDSPLGEAEVAGAEGALFENEADKTNAEARYHYALASVNKIGSGGVHAKQLQNALDQLGKRVNDTSDAE